MVCSGGLRLRRLCDRTPTWTPVDTASEGRPVSMSGAR